MSNTYKVCVTDETANKQHCVEIESHGVPVGVLSTAISAVLSVVTHLFSLGAKSHARD